MNTLEATRLASCTLAVLLLATGCGRSGAPALYTPVQANAVGTSLDQCPTLASNVTLTDVDGNSVITKACFVDEEGNFYPSGLSDSSAEVPVLPDGHHYAIVYQFADGWLTSAAAAAATAASFVYAAPDILPSDTCNNSGVMPFPEDNASNLVSTSTTVDGNTLTQTISDPVPDGQQIVPWLDLSTLLAGSSTRFFGSGFNLRAYIGSAPPCPSAWLQE